MMKTFWSVLAKVLFVFVLIQGWFLYDFYHKNEALVADNVNLEQQLLAANESLDAANEKIVTLEKNSLDSVLKETNEAVVQGWETLLDAVEGELEKAKKSIGSTIDDLRPEEPTENDSLDTPEPEESIKKPSNIIPGERT